MTWPAPSRAAHNDFCLAEGWETVRGATGHAVRHHVTYEKELPDGRILRTRVSQPPNKDTYGTDLWHHILRDQLEVDEATFWACVNDGVLPDRGQIIQRQEAVPADLVHLLITRLHLSEKQVAELSKGEAIALMAEYWQQETP